MQVSGRLCLLRFDGLVDRCERIREVRAFFSLETARLDLARKSQFPKSSGNTARDGFFGKERGIVHLYECEKVKRQRHITDAMTLKEVRKE